MEKPTGTLDTPDEAAKAQAIGLIVLATTMFSCLDATAKYLVLESGLPVGQIVWTRFTAQLLGMLLLIPACGIMSARQLFTTPAPLLQLTRSTMLALVTVFNFLALQYLQLAQTITIMFLAPLAVALLAGPLLGEWVGWRRLAAILVGFSGVLIVVRPGFTDMSIGVVYSLAAMLGMTFFTLLTRPLAARDPALVTLFYSMLAGVVLGAPYVWFYGVWPSDLSTWILMLAMGLFGGLGHYLFILAFARASTSVLSPFLYAQIISMVLLGYLVFRDLPGLYTIVGSLIIVASGLYLYHRERIVRTQQT